MHGKHARSVAEQVYGRLLLVYPLEFRLEYGTEMIDFFRESYQEEQRRGGGLMYFWMKTFGDLLATASKQHLDMFGQDLRQALRLLRGNPTFTAIALLTLTLGIGANTAMFSIVNAVLLRPLPYKESGQLVQVWNRARSAGSKYSVSYLDLLDWQEQNRVFTGLAAWENVNLNLTGQGKPRQVRGAKVTANFFDVLGAQARMGRAFLKDEDKPGKSQVVLVSHDFWQEQFGGDPTLVGENLILDDQSYTVIGIASPSLRLPGGGTQLWVPLVPTRDQRSRGNTYLEVLARLKSDVPQAQAQTEMDTIASRLAAQYPQTNTERGIRLVPLHEEVVGKARPALLVLFAAVGCVLLIACVNVANLLFARAAARQREIVIRLAVGASRFRLIRQLLTESLLLALLGSALGLVFAYGGLAVLNASGAVDLPRAREITVDLWVLGFNLLLALVTGVGFGLVPALQASKLDLNESLKETGGRASGGLPRNRLRGLLVSGEIALALVLLACAGLLIQSFSQLLRTDPGFDPRNVLSMELALPSTRYPQGHQRTSFYRGLIERLETIKGVQSAAIVNNLPFTGSNNYSGLTLEGRPVRSPADRLGTFRRDVTADYFQAMGIPLRAGRYFGQWDGVQGSKTALIDEQAAREYFPNQDPLGRRFSFEEHPRVSDWFEVVGVIGSVKFRTLGEAPEAQIYVPSELSPDPNQSVFLVVRAVPGFAPAGLTADIRSAVLSMDPNQPVSDVQTMEQRLSVSVAQPRLTALLLGGFATAALLLAAIGLYGVISYSIAQRTHEVGIRMALGASRADILGLILKEGGVLILRGVAVGLCAAFALSRIVASLLYSAGSSEPLIFTAVSTLLILVALLACYIPARRATRVDPMIALRYE